MQMCVYESVHILVLRSCRKKLPVDVFHHISTRLLSVSETAIALRPFIFSVHPDLFGKFPKEQVIMTIYLPLRYIVMLTVSVWYLKMAYSLLNNQQTHVALPCHWSLCALMFATSMNEHQSLRQTVTKEKCVQHDVI